MSGPAPLLRCTGVAVSRGPREILHGVDLEIAPGEVVALLGPNGAGKSTLLDAIGGALTPTAGTIERGGRIAVALQAPDLANRSVAANLAAALAWWGVPRSARPERIRSALAAMGAEHLIDRRARALSGGERRRVHLARVLALAPDLLVLDEPFAGLDPEVRARLLADTGAALRSGARAALVVVHDRTEAWALADRLAILLDGRIAADGPPRELLEAPPTPAVARFLGFDGELDRGPLGRWLTRPQHVALDPHGELEATVSALVPTEDGVRLELTLPGGRLFALGGLPSPRVGDTVRLRLTGGVRMPEAQPEPTVAGAAAQLRRP